MNYAYIRNKYIAEPFQICSVPKIATVGCFYICCKWSCSQHDFRGMEQEKYKYGANLGIP